VCAIGCNGLATCHDAIRVAQGNAEKVQEVVAQSPWVSVMLVYWGDLGKLRFDGTRQTDVSRLPLSIYSVKQVAARGIGVSYC
jgi:hypothetical protein